MASQTFPEPLNVLKLFLDRTSPKDKEIIQMVVRLMYLGPAHPEFPRHLLLARLILFPYEAPTRFAWEDIPPPYVENFVHFKMEPCLFVYSDDVEQYYNELVTSLNAIAALIENLSVTASTASTCMLAYILRIGMHNIMCTDVNMRPFMEDRYRILSLYARAKYSIPLDYPFGQREVGRSKIRLGVLLKTRLAGGESRAAALNLSKLDRNKYEITLLSFGSSVNYISDTAFEAALRESVDHIIDLKSDEVIENIQKIRELDLDILWHQSHIGLIEFNPIGEMLVYRLARCQCATQIMHTATTGNPFFTYYLGVNVPYPDAIKRANSRKRFYAFRGAACTFRQTGT